MKEKTRQFLSHMVRRPLIMNRGMSNDRGSLAQIRRSLRPELSHWSIKEKLHLFPLLPSRNRIEARALSDPTYKIKIRRSRRKIWGRTGMTCRSQAAAIRPTRAPTCLKGREKHAIHTIATQHHAGTPLVCMFSIGFVHRAPAGEQLPGIDEHADPCRRDAASTCSS